MEPLKASTWVMLAIFLTASVALSPWFLVGGLVIAVWALADGA